MDEDVKQSMNNLAESEQELSRSMRTPAWGKDFSHLARSDLGADREIEDARDSMRLAQNEQRHRIAVPEKNDAGIYQVPGVTML